MDAMEVAPAALLLEGDPGIGKTTVWRSAQAAAVARGHRVLAVTAVEGEADLPFVALRDLFESVSPDTALALPPPQRAALDVALLRSADPRAVADQHAVCVAALGIIRTMAAELPLVIAVDDVGWLDRSSDRVLRYVIRRLATEPVGVLAARRPGSAAPLGLDGPPLDARLHRVALGPLDPDAVHTLLTERCGLQLPRRLTRRIHAACGGNPFSAVEIGRTLLARGERIVDESALPLPGGVLRVTAERIAALSPAAQQALAVVAVSAGASPALLTAALGDDAVDALDEAVGEGLLQVDGSAVRFAHPLMRSAAAANLTVRERRRMHARLAALVSDPDECAVHLAAATVGPDESVAAAVEKAARRAFLRGAPDVAAVLAARAVALTPPAAGDALIRRRIHVGEYRYRAEDMDAARTALSELVAELPDGELRAEALLWLACVRKAQNGMAEAAELARAALAQARGNGLRAAAERLLAQALVFVGAVSSAHRHAAVALVTARTTGDPDLGRREQGHAGLDPVLGGPRPAHGPARRRTLVHRVELLRPAGGDSGHPRGDPAVLVRPDPPRAGGAARRGPQAHRAGPGPTPGPGPVHAGRAGVPRGRPGRGAALHRAGADGGRAGGRRLPPLLADLHARARRRAPGPSRRRARRRTPRRRRSGSRSVRRSR